MVTPRIEWGTDCVRCGMAERASVIDMCAPLERRRVHDVTSGPAMVATPTSHCPSWISDRTCTFYHKLTVTVRQERKSDNSILVEMVTPCGGEPSMQLGNKRYIHVIE